jgi:hypothetical protein
VTSGPPNVPSGPPPEGYQGAAPTSTWDDWLSQRPDPFEKERPTSADLVAFLLRHKLADALDFSRQHTRDGMLQLFTEFEKATAGQRITVRDDSQWRGTAVPSFDVTAEVAKGQVSLSFRQTGDSVADYRLTSTQAAALLVQLLRAVEEIEPGPQE